MKNNLSNRIDKITEKYLEKRIAFIGIIWHISYADLGKTLIINITGDVPTGMQPVEITIVHPSSDRDGWIGKGNIGYNINCEGIPIDKIPLHEDAIFVIKEIYRAYTGESYYNFNRQNNISKFFLGFHNTIIENERKNKKFA